MMLPALTLWQREIVRFLRQRDRVVGALVTPVVLFLLLAPVAGVPVSVAGLPGLLAAMFLVSFALTGLGFLIAWQLNSSQGFHAIMNLFLIPMWLLSGALFPASGAQKWMAWVMKLNPLTYGVTAIRLGLYWTSGPVDWVPMIVTAVFAGVMFGLSLWAAQR